MDVFIVQICVNTMKYNFPLLWYSGCVICIYVVFIPLFLDYFSSSRSVGMIWFKVSRI